MPEWGRAGVSGAPRCFQRGARNHAAQWQSSVSDHPLIDRSGERRCLSFITLERSTCCVIPSRNLKGCLIRRLSPPRDAVVPRWMCPLGTRRTWRCAGSRTPAVPVQVWAGAGGAPVAEPGSPAGAGGVKGSGGRRKDVGEGGLTAFFVAQALRGSAVLRNGPRAAHGVSCNSVQERTFNKIPENNRA